MHSHTRMPGRRTIFFFFTVLHCKSKCTMATKCTVLQSRWSGLREGQTSYAGLLTSTQVRWKVLVVNKLSRLLCNGTSSEMGGKTQALLSNYQNHTKILYCSIWSTSSEDSKILVWRIPSSRPVSYFEIHERQWTKRWAERWKRTGWGGGGVMSVVGSSLTLLVDQGDSVSLSPPSQSPLWTSWPSGGLQCWLWDGWWTESAACPTAEERRRFG